MTKSKAKPVPATLDTEIPFSPEEGPGPSFGYEKITIGDQGNYLATRIGQLEGEHYALGVNLVELQVDLEMSMADGSPEINPVFAQNIDLIHQQREGIEKKIAALKGIIATLS